MKFVLSIAVFLPHVLAQGTVEGTVADAVTHAGIPGVQVRMYARGGASYASITDLAARSESLELPMAPTALRSREKVLSFHGQRDQDRLRGLCC